VATVTTCQSTYPSLCHSADNDGKITIAELDKMLRTLCRNVTDAQLADILKSADKDQNGTIEKGEFVSMVTKILKENIDMLYSFVKDYDTDGDGFIDKTELENAMGHFGKPSTCRIIVREAESVNIGYTPEMVEELLKDSDKNGDGKIDFKGT
jgi:Ca2+-binding EF-hand superfamily protein